MNGVGILTFIALASVMLWFIISGRGKWWPKLIAILAVVGFSAILWFSALSFTGWPTHSQPPKLALFVAGLVVEPTDNEDGVIYLWLVSPPANSNIYEYEAKNGEPRAYVLPYSRELHEQVQAAQGLVGAGKRVAYSKAVQGPKDSKPVVSKPQAGNGNNLGTVGEKPGLYILPPVTSQPKG